MSYHKCIQTTVASSLRTQCRANNALLTEALKMNFPVTEANLDGGSLDDLVPLTFNAAACSPKRIRNEARASE